MFKQPLKNFYKTNKSLISNLGLFQQRSLHTKVVNILDSGSFIAELRHDMNYNESKEVYTKRSWQEFNALLNPDIFCMYVDKATLKNGYLSPGHIASFLTDSNNNRIINSSFMSLRNGVRVPNKTLKFKLHDGVERQNSIWKVDFIESKEEIEDYFFKRAVADISPKMRSKRYLIGVPIIDLIPSLQKVKEFSSVEEARELLLARIEEVKEKFKDAEYILCDGYMDDEFVKRVNCIVGFYESLFIQGTMQNPSPQMAAWSYLKLLYGPLVRDELIRGTEFRKELEERSNDDNLEVIDRPNDNDYTFKP